ncbi:methylated-DNA--[protein]-cysteine S-methyltransferase [Guyparkeria halophila]|uniref:Methylated-DNA--[protein]-cysteine S-methyltransferase n=1 Tax=Guyparkeria halophila TaxID=47960 RepID=A0ABZ0YVQ6_9GAMM|nr:methylated-DNA--[protein]-cysteine S-methyltransferase [Guyparkeria halophila]WQH15454.1 methylated-DNA--[protein]-cysteine S-methyltransferase [Guyparkeria halophila]
MPLGHRDDSGSGHLWVRLAFTHGMLTRMQVEEAPVDERRVRDVLPTEYADVGELLNHWDKGIDNPFDWTTHPGFPPVGTTFQRAVWSALCRVPWGESVGYGELARRVGRPGAARAVGQAVGANPWAPLIPCHRVLAANQGLGGYAQGTRIKSRLLALEGTAYR